MPTVLLKEHYDMECERRGASNAYRSMGLLIAEIEQIVYDDLSDFMGDLMANAMFEAGVESDELGDANMREAMVLLRRKVAGLLTEAR